MIRVGTGPIVGAATPTDGDHDACLAAVIGLAGKASYPSQLEPACTTVIAVGDRCCRSVKGVLAAGSKREALGVPAHHSG